MEEQKPTLREEESARVRQFAAERDAPCPFCGYNLRGVGMARCPECGGNVDVEILRDGPNKGEERLISGDDREPLGRAAGVILGVVFLGMAVWLVYAAIWR